jgi:hypothetical protein
MRTLKFLLTIPLLSLIVACASSHVSPTVMPTPTVTAITDYASLVAAFEKRGIAVQPGETHWDLIFSHAARRLDLPKATLSVLEYSTEAEAMAVVQTISPYGNSVDRKMISWSNEPHFYRVNRLIVLYLGYDQSVIDQLQQVLGPQFAGVPTPQPTGTRDPALERLPLPPTPTASPR